MRFVDLHVHLPVTEWLDGSLGPFRASAERYFRRDVALSSAEELAQRYADADGVAVLLGWDAETATGRPRLSNDLVAEIVQRFPGRFLGLAGIDPWKGPAALDEMRRARHDLGLAGFKFHPSMQAFRPDDERFDEVFALAEAERGPCLFHTGTSGIGAGMPGGQGIQLGFARPIHLDAVAARHPELQIVMAHFGWPWHAEALAIAMHKTNVWIEVSGWRPKYVPAEVRAEAEGRLGDRMLFGSDAPFFDVERVLAEWEELLSPAAFARLAAQNAAALLGLRPIAEPTS